MENELEKRGSMTDWRTLDECMLYYRMEEKQEVNKQERVLR
jgi:hypothetical protein